MKTKTILPLLATLTILPFGARAELTITNEDKEHIASTAYVKGAYNDLDAKIDQEVNHLSDDINTKQDQMITNTGDSMTNMALDASMFVEALTQDPVGLSETDTYFVTAGAVASGLMAQRVDIYTTWDNDNATKPVSFYTAALSAQSGQ